MTPTNSRQWAIVRVANNINQKHIHMVRVTNYAERENSAGEKFYSLILQGTGIEMVKSQETGRFYATSKQASVTSTFDEETCKSLIGEEITGSIKKLETDPYEFTIPDTGEVVVLNHRWQYLPEGDTMEEIVFEGKPVGAEAL